MGLYFRGGLTVKLDADAAYTATTSEEGVVLVLGAAQDKRECQTHPGAAWTEAPEVDVWTCTSTHSHKMS